MNFTSGATVAEILSLDNIRNQLIRLEDTIIFSLIERAQFAHNPRIYQAGAFKAETGHAGSWLEWFLLETESFHGKSSRFRRYTSPDEHPFTPLSLLPQPILPPQDYPIVLHPPSAQHPSTNANTRILNFYVDSIVPTITKPVLATRNGLTDDGNYGSAATRDVEVLQALSRRIHFGESAKPEAVTVDPLGMFVSESKFQSAPHLFIPHIQSNPPNTEALTALIYKPEVEARLLVRLANKAKVYGGEFDGEGRILENEAQRKIDIGGVVSMYRDYVIPLTKDVEVDYLIHRLDGVSQDQIDAWSRFARDL